MKVVRISDVPEQEVTGGIFTGAVRIRSLVNEATGSKDLSIAIVHFPKGVRNVFHSHDGDQVLYILEGKGIVATEKEEITAIPGMVFFIPAGENHWHGAMDDSDFTHISILRPGKTEVKKEVRNSASRK
ncbi:cupin domain-containing protein [Thermofilum sp.]|uniref:cupin domain-containing protein n=1 Tax=Thermofilum sp. TaxID=1961369 RepID=UPI00315F434E|nr:cupin domain-containing protein [Candidatus Brockarchaeota archaeon]